MTPPSIHELGADLLRVTNWQRTVVILRPLLAFATYWIFAYFHWWIPAVLAVVALMFLTYTSSSHDYVHRTLHLPRWANELLLAATELLGLRAGHAFRVTHLQHHRHFPAPEDPEGFPACRGLWPALLSGPLHQVRLFTWAFRHGQPAERRWMLAEAAAIAATLAYAMLARPLSLCVFVVLVTGGAWFYPVMTVWWPHRDAGANPLEHTRLFRGRWVPALFLHHTYHLEHHLYPMVASPNWRRLAQRLDPWFARQGLPPILLP
ncbi:MAG: fatty acid desaturase [Bryobacteraceae bacterium]|nr:fatty acid desaturase [Bryobacteraceae bacterium]